MPAARYWRLIGLEAYGQGELELSELQLHSGAGRLDVGVTPTSSHAPVGGALGNLTDSDTATICRFSGAQVRSAGFFIAWDLGAARDAMYVRPGSAAAKSTYIKAATLQYLDAGVWKTQANLGCFLWPGAYALDASSSAGDSLYPNVALLLHGDGVDGSASIIDSGPLGLVPSSVPASVRISTDQVTAFNGSSIKFTGAALLYDHHASLAPAGDYCIDVRLFTPVIDGASQRTILIKSVATGHRTYSLDINSNGTIQFTASNTAGTAVVLNRSSTDKVVVGFNRIEVGRIGNNVYLFLNGLIQWINAFTGGNYINASHPLSIGNLSTNTFPLSANGAAYIEELRITAGAGRNTTSYTPETTAFPNVAVGSVLFGPFPNVVSHTKPAVAARAPVPAHSTRSASRLQSARDVEHGGLGTIYGTTKTKGTPNTPTKARVVLLHQRSKLPVREVWSDPVTGNFAFTGLDTKQKFMPLVELPSGAFAPLAASDITPSV